MVQRDARLDPEAPEGGGPFALEGQRLLGEPPGLGLDGAALDRIAVRVDAERGQEREVGFPAGTVPGALAAARAALAQAAAALPLGPVVVRRPLDLVGRGGDAPEKGAFSFQLSAHSQRRGSERWAESCEL